MEHKKPPTYLIAILIFLLLLSISIAGFFAYQTQRSKPVACTMEAKICPDGSAVGRSGPKCEFAPCPTTSPRL
ncbi:MAG: hypothetical protein QY322_03510 [bacterium]|nr:MAG: hypothetical protein QY322_03510 [bacterium]